MQRKCTQAELDSFVAAQIAADGDRAQPLKSISEAADYASVTVDLLWPDIPYGWTTEEFMESYNRQLKERGITDGQNTDGKKE